MNRRSTSKIFGGDGYRELYAKEAATKSSGKVPDRYKANSKLLEKLMVSDRKRRKISERAGKLVVPRASGHAR